MIKWFESPSGQVFCAEGIWIRQAEIQGCVEIQEPGGSGGSVQTPTQPPKPKKPATKRAK